MPTAPSGPLTLDAEVAAVCRRLAGSLFPWDTTRALELALLKTFCLPSISGLLARTGEFTERPRKRYDDTGLMMAELLRWGPDSAEGRAVIHRMNRIHGAYGISNHDFLYVLSTFVAEPIRWLERYGWRPLQQQERQAWFRFWDHVGALMAIQNRPASLEAMLSLNGEVEAKLFRSAPSNHRVAEATLGMLLAEWPEPLRQPLATVLRGVLDPEVLASLDWRPAPPWLARVLRAGLWGRSRLLNLRQRIWPPRRTRFYSERSTPSYGSSFQLEQLGPPALLPRLNSPRWDRAQHGAQRRIGLTGGIATGKSSVGRLLAEQGLPVLDADQFAREALAPGSAGARAVLARHGASVREVREGKGPESQSVDRAALGRIVFGDPAERAWLEQLVHPLVRQRFEAELQRLADRPVVVLMIPLLFEAGLEGLCSEVWLVDCDPEQQLGRLIARDGLEVSEAGARIAAQWPLERKRSLADLVIDNRASPGALASAVAQALRSGPGLPPGAGPQGAAP
ncbi:MULTISPECIES: dephospho-CoA kinase [Aphanothece]|uniref:dephospho-CoA kinase n=1 Tax=Aphanothece TaxID=1121 RepID=UPI0039852FD2